MEKAYEKAKEAGYDGRLYAPKLGAELLDPKFWQALGKSLGWGKTKSGRDTFAGKNWKREWHKFIDHLAEGKDTDSFFEELLKPHDTTL